MEETPAVKEIDAKGKAIAKRIAIVGAALVLAGIIWKVAAGVFMDGRASFDDVDHSFWSESLIMFGALVLFTAGGIRLLTSRRIYRLSREIQQDSSAAIAKGALQGLRDGVDGNSSEVRLERLSNLRQKGLITEAEYETKRSEILSKL